MARAISGKGGAEDLQTSLMDCRLNENVTRVRYTHHPRTTPQARLDSISFDSTFSTNYTMSDLAGTGRVLGNLYSTAGRRLEKVLGVVAGKIGYGPEAAYRSLQHQCRQSSKQSNANRNKGQIKS